LPKTKIKQHDITDCGAACLASVAAHFKLQIPITRIRQYANTDKKGTNVLGMIEAAEMLGFQAKGVKGVPESLAKIPKPTIAHVIKNEKLHHYVVIYAVTDKYVTVMDPGPGKIEKIKIEDFLKEWTGVLILLLPTDAFQIGNQKTSTLSRFWQLMKPNTAVMLQALVGAAVYTILGLSTSIFIQKITDNVIVEGNKNLLNLLGVGMVLILLLQVILGFVKSLFALKTGQRMDASLILGYYKHLLKLPQQFFDTMRVGEIISRVNDAVKIRVFINDTLISLAVNVFIVVFSFGLMFTYYWKLALLMLSIIPFYVLIYFIVNRINRKQQRQLMEDSAELEAQLVESLNSVATIKRFGIEEMMNLKTETKFVSLLKTIYKSGSSSLFIGSTSEFVTRLLTIVLLWVGTYFVIDQELTPGELLSFYALVGYFTGPIQSIIGTNKSIQEALIAADRLFEIIDLEREQEENKMKLTPEMVGNIRFENVNFRYGSRVQVFDDLTLQINKGEITAIIGESGSGKSTLMYLLQNLYPLKSGNIIIGDFDIKNISPESLRKIVSVVPQQIDLLSGSLMENISLGDFNPDMKRIVDISNLLGNTAFIEKLPQGFNTRLGEHGTNLSGGQRQRIAIARALYRNPEILIMDEATSALDVISEKNIQNAIEFLKSQGKTIILIAHRLSTIKNADKILVLENGKLVQEGNHESLLPVDGVYKKLWNQAFEQ
jgi:ATP-binding cassette, subfamily C, bacteriocin exporter